MVYRFIKQLACLSAFLDCCLLFERILGSYLYLIVLGMSLDRKQLISSIFRRLDPNQRGYVTLQDFDRHYRTSVHSSTVAGSIGSGEPLSALVLHFYDPNFHTSKCMLHVACYMSVIG